MTVLTPKSDQSEILSYREDLRRNFFPGKRGEGGGGGGAVGGKGDMNPVMYSILKMVEYKVQIITFSQKVHDFTHT